MNVKEMIERLQKIVDEQGEDFEVKLQTKHDFEDVEGFAFVKTKDGDKHSAYIRVYGEEGIYFTPQFA